MKKILAMLAIGTMLLGTMTGCGNQTNEAESSANLEGTCSEILAQVYETAEVEEDFKQSLQFYENTAITEESEEVMIGTTNVDYIDSVYSAPMMSSVAYQCVILRLEEGENVEEVKQELLDSADPRKWVCVEPESIYVENVGDVVLCLMGNEPNATAVKDAFLALGNEE